MKTIMIIPAGLYQLPAIIKAKGLGLRVVTADYLRDNPGHKQAHVSEVISIVDQNSLLDLARREKVDGIFTIASDIAVKSVGYIAREMGLVESMPYTNIDKICIKHQFRELQRQSGLPFPAFVPARTFAEFKRGLNEVGLPAVVKPSDSSGSKGLFVIDQIYPDEQLAAIYHQSLSFSRNKILCIEQLLNGIHVGGSALVTGGSVVFYQLTNKYLTQLPLMIPTGHSIPSALEAGTQAGIMAAIQQVVNLLDIRVGALDFDILVTDEDIVIIEMSPRLGGNCIPKIIEYGTGLDLIETAIMLAMGKQPDIRAHKALPVGVRILGCSKAGVVSGFKNLQELKEKYKENLIELVLDISVGSRVSRFTNGSFRIGHIICKASSLKELDSLLDKIEKELQITVGGRADSTSN